MFSSGISQKNNQDANHIFKKQKKKIRPHTTCLLTLRYAIALFAKATDVGDSAMLLE